METLIKRLCALLDVKSIITITLVSVGCIGFMQGVIGGEVFASWVSAIMVYFFNKDRKE